MANRFKGMFSSLKKSFLNDKLGFILLSFCYLFLFLTVSTLPLFTYTSNSLITNLLSIGSVFFIVIYLFFRGKIILNSFIVCYLLFVIYAIIVTLCGTNKFGFDRLLSIVTLYSLTICIMEFGFNKKCLNFFVFSMCVSAILFSLFFAITYKTEILTLSFSERLGSDYGNVNQIATIFDIGFLFLIYTAISKKRIYFFLLLPALVCLFFTILTGSRWGLVSLVFGFAVLFYLLVGRRYKLEFLIAAVFAVLLVIILLQLPAFSFYKKHFSTVFDFFTKPNKKGSSSMRMSMIIDGFRMWFRNLIFGFGAEGFNANSSYGVYSHSTYVELLTNFGLIGFLLFAYPIYALLNDTLVLKRQSKFLFMSGIVIFFIFYSLFSMFHISKPGIICLGFFFGYNYFCNSHLHRSLIISFNNENKVHFSCEYKPIQQNAITNDKHIKKIGFVISSLHKGGAERVASILANCWIEKGYEVTFFLTTKVSGSQYSLNKNIKVIEIVDNNFVRLIPSLKINRLINEIEKEKPDILVSFLIAPMYYASCASKELQIPLVCSERNDPSMSGNFIYKVMKSIAFKRADYVVFQGEQAQSYFKKDIIDKSSIIINPCLVEKVTSKTTAKTIIAAGRLTDQKGFDVLITAFNDIIKSHPDYNLKIYGDGVMKNDLEKMIQNLELQNSVSILPFSDSLHQEMASSSMFVSSSRYEGMPNVLCEAMLLGLPVVATNCPIGLSKEIVFEHKNGEICNFDNSIELSNSIMCVLNNLTSYNKNAKELVPYYEKLLDPSQIADKWLDVLNIARENFDEKNKK